MIFTVYIISYRYKKKKNVFFLVIRTFKVYSFSNFPASHTAVLSIAPVLYVTTPVLLYFMTGSLYLLTTFLQFPHPSSFPCVWWPFPVFDDLDREILVNYFVECSSMGFVSWLDRVMGFLEEDRRGYSAILITSCQSDILSAWCWPWSPGWGRVNWFLHCEVTHPPLLYSLEGSHLSQPTLKGCYTADFIFS